MFTRAQMSTLAVPAAAQDEPRTPVCSSQLTARGARHELSRIAIAAPARLQRSCAACDEAEAGVPAPVIARMADEEAPEAATEAAPAVSPADVEAAQEATG